MIDTFAIIEPTTIDSFSIFTLMYTESENNSFVLDCVLIENDNSAPLATYWNTYKNEHIVYAIQKFINMI